MRFNSKVIAGLAWAGLVVILAVPSADLVSSQLAPKASLAMTSDMDAVQTGSIADPVEAYTATGKPLPSYLSEAAAPVPAAPVVRTIPATGSATPPTAVASTTPVDVTLPATPSTPAVATPGSSWLPEQVAAINPVEVAPVPYPVSMRPKAPVVTDSVVILDENEVAALPDSEQPHRPPAAIKPRLVTEDELADWDSGTLADYLERKGLMEGTAPEESTAAYDPDGFFLDEGPNNHRTVHSRSRHNRDDGFFVVFPDDF